MPFAGGVMVSASPPLRSHGEASVPAPLAAPDATTAAPVQTGGGSSTMKRVTTSEQPSAYAIVISRRYSWLSISVAGQLNSNGVTMSGVAATATLLPGLLKRVNVTLAIGLPAGAFTVTLSSWAAPMIHGSASVPEPPEEPVAVMVALAQLIGSSWMKRSVCSVQPAAFLMVMTTR
jgi:hypothetical protein